MIARAIRSSAPASRWLWPCFAFAICALSAGGPFAQEKTPPGVPTGLPPSAVDAFVAPLSDTEARQLLIVQLKQQASSPAAGAPETGGSVLGQLNDVSHALRSRKDGLAAAVASAPASLKEAFDNLTDSEGWPAFWRGILALLLTLAVAGIAEYLVTLAMRRGKHAAEAELGDGYTQRLAVAGVFLFARMLRLLSFALAAYLASFVFLDRLDPLREMVIAIVLIIVGCRIVAILADAMFAPGMPRRRLAFADDRAARELKWHLVAFGGGIVVIFVARDFLSVIGLPPQLTAVFVVIAGGLAMGFLVATLVGDFLIEEGSPFGRVAPVLLAGLLIAGFLGWATATLMGWQHGARDMALAAAILVALPPAERMLRGLVLGFAPDGPQARPGRRGQTERSHRWVIVALRVTAGLAILSLIADAIGTRPSSLLGQRFVDAALSVGVTMLVATAAWQAISIAISRKLGNGVRETDDPTRDAEEAGGLVATRTETLLPLVRTFLWFTLIAIVGMMALSNLGVDIGPLLAGAGVVGLAIGFGAQTLVRDIVAGIFFLIDDAFRVGEYIEFGETRGEVEKISIRSLILRHHRGAIHVVPFGELKSITNYNRDWSIFKMEFGVPYETDIEKVRKIIKNIGLELLKDPEYGPKFLEPLKSQGVIAFGNSALTVRLKFKCRPREQFVLRRIVHQRIKQAFDENGISFAYPRVVVEGSSPTLAAAAAAAANGVSAARPAG